MTKITNGITNILIESGTISEKERKLYSYCIGGVVEMGANLVLTLLLGVVMGKFAETLLFLVIIIPLRSSAGGFHANNTNSCFVLSILMYLSTIFVAGMISSKLNYIYSIPIFVICSVCILVLSPVDCKNKRLSKAEKAKQKKICIFIILIISIVFSVMVALKLNNFCFLISTCVLAIFSMMIAGKIKDSIAK